MTNTAGAPSRDDRRSVVGDAEGAAGGGGQIVGKAGAGYRRVLPGGPAGLGQATRVGGGGIADRLVAPLVLHPDPDDVLPRRRRPGRRAAGGGGRDGGDPRAGRHLGPEGEQVPSGGVDRDADPGDVGGA